METRRGLRGRVELGKSGGGVSFGYRIVRTFKDGVVATGEREIVPEEAEIIRRIYRDDVAGVSPKQAARDLRRYRRWRIEKATPEPDFRYRSNVVALASSLNAITTSTCHGAPRAVDRHWPALCWASRAETSEVRPV